MKRIFTSFLFVIGLAVVAQGGACADAMDEATNKQNECITESKRKPITEDEIKKLLVITEPIDDNARPEYESRARSERAQKDCPLDKFLSTESDAGQTSNVTTSPSANSKTCKCGTGLHAKTCAPNADGKCEIVKCDDGYVLDDRKICVTNVCAKDDCTKLDKNATKCTRSVYNTCDKIVECDKKTSELKNGRCELKHKSGEKCDCSPDVANGVCTYDKDKKCVLSGCNSVFHLDGNKCEADGATCKCPDNAKDCTKNHENQCIVGACTDDNKYELSKDKTKCVERKHTNGSACKCSEHAKLNADKCIWENDSCIIAPNGCKGGYEAVDSGKDRKCVKGQTVEERKKSCLDSAGTWLDTQNQCACDIAKQDASDQKVTRCIPKTNVACENSLSSDGEKCDWYIKDKNLVQKIVKCKENKKIPNEDGSECKDSPAAEAYNKMISELGKLNSAFTTKVSSLNNPK